MYWYYIIALFLIGMDQLTKWLIVRSMEIGESIPIIDGFFYLTSHRNQGAAWGILQGKMLFFYIVTVIVIIAVVYYMNKFAKTDKWLGLGLSFILGGALGNFIDRIFRKEVVDFFDFYIINYNFPIFNIADSALTIGVIFVIIATILDERKKGRTNK
ncbi:signal peptidase II [Oceanobacillus caeni]|uniref:Lipoprotein signal peptidase n=1 Tax=Oceanobacillus caeni TaxID=405946 RepID=A0ABR5MLV5_9BACI|nr:MULTISPECIES: signal peptidase II [Bacillaceae]KKE78045.1 peptidase A8 [Bacilli bacterium VT-13-104]PZD85701.1 lipoprotein signal peptidase [Bacilli bacterium]KPH77166.1 peptidase A8 [Oceanobacillus caeni]MBU8790162.1 signal peptidase II [Oceanobacillus caeni]MCR1835606.1 signal peptidase II [Oceanobacillus caeni]